MIKEQDIIRISAQLFASYGIRTNTMDDIASKAGISKKTLYQWVADKNELVNSVINFEYANIKDSLKAIKLESNNSIEELIKVNAFIINFLKEINPVAISDLQKLYNNVYNDSKIRFKSLFTNFILKSIQEGKQSGIFRKDINEELIANLHTDRIDKMQESSGFWGTTSSSPVLIKDMITYYLRGLVTKQGEILLDKHLNDFDKYIVSEYR